MKSKHRFVPYFIIAIPLMLVLVVSLFITAFYFQKVSSCFEMAKRSVAKECNVEKSKNIYLVKEFENELVFVVLVAASITLFFMILSFMLSKKINKIITEYQNEIEKSADELKELNSVLEQKVKDEVSAHRQKEKILIQKSKMADMGDMLSMIAHQWRQPLNQLSYIFMNIQAACDEEIKDKRYIQNKIKEGESVLEFTSATIDDFRNYFRPDKQKEFVLVSGVVDTALMLIKDSLKKNSIEYSFVSQGRELTYLYKNEFIQVVLNIIKNAQDVLVSRGVDNPKIEINSIANTQNIVVKICDNGGGIESENLQKIFEPYFSTKDKKTATGLGLYMSKMIIEEHLGGRLSVTNTNDGACFEIEL